MCQTLFLPLPFEFSEFFISLKKSFHSRLSIHEFTFSLIKESQNEKYNSEKK